MRRRRGRRNIRRPKKLGIVGKDHLFHIREEVLPTIITVPLHPDSGKPIMKKLEVIESKKVRIGWHNYYTVLTITNRGDIIRREVIE